MANAIIQAIYDLKDNVSAKIKLINDTLRGNRAESDKTTASVEKNNQRQSESYKKQADSIGFLRENLGKIAAAAAAAGAALKLIDFGRGAFTAAADVEHSLSRVKAIAQSTSEQFEALGDQIQKSAVAANVSSEAAAGAAAALAEQGQSATEIFETLTPTLLLARDANIEVAEAAGIVDDALDLFGKSAGDAALVVDQLVVASKGSKEGLAGLATAVRGLAPDAQALGLSFEQLTGLLGLMGQNGIDAGKAARGLRSVFQELQDPTSQLSTSLGKLGDSSGDFGTAIETLRNSGDGGKEALLGLDGAARSLVLFLLQQAPGAVGKFTESLKEAKGAASEMRKVLDDDLKGAATELFNAFDHLGAGLAKSSLGPLRDELQKLAGQLNAFAESPAFAELQKALGDVFKEGAEAFDNFIQRVDWGAFVSDAQTSLKNAGRSIGEFKDDLSSVATALNTIGSSIGVVFRSVAVVFDLAKVGISGLMVGIASGLLAQSKSVDILTGKTSQLTIALEAVRDSAKDAANKGITALREDSDKLVSNLEGLGGTAEETSRKIDALNASFKNVKAGVDATSDTFAQTATDFNVLTGGVENVANALGILPELFNADAVAATAASDAHTAHARAIVAANEAVNDAREALVKLAESGDKNSVAFQQASNALVKAQGELDKLTGKTDQAADSQRGLAQAFKDLHIASQAELKKASEDAEKSLDTIRRAFLANNATIEDVKRAYDAYAAAVKASVADSSASVQQQAQATLQAKAAALGLTDAVTQAGAAGKDAGEATATAFGSAKENIEGAAAAADNLKQNANDAADGLAGVADAAETTGRNVTDAGASIVLLTADQLRGLQQLKEEILAGGLSLADYEKRVQDVMAGTTQSIQEQIDQLRRFEDQLAQINSEIASASGDDRTVEEIRHEQRLKDLENEFQTTDDLTRQQYQRLVEAEKKLHDIKMKNIQAQQDASAGNANQGGGSSTTTGGSGSNTPQPIQPRAAGALTLNVNVEGSVIGGTQQQIAESLARLIKPQLDRIAAMSR